MTTDVLGELGLAPDQLHTLTSNERSHLLYFMLRWEHLQALHDCLDVLIPANPTLVSLLDLRARAFLAQERAGEALEVMQERLQLKSSLTARSLLARIYLAQGSKEAAREVALALVQEQPDSTTAWQLLAEVELARGEIEAAQAAYWHLRELRPDGRAYLMGMVDLYEAQGDWVTASGYAVRTLQSASAEHPLIVHHLRRLMAYWRASGETTRAVEVGAELERRRAEEWTALRAALGAEPRARDAAAPALQPEDAPASGGLPAFDEVPVSEEEQARIVQAARQIFGFEALLPGQLQAIACVLRGEDVLTILPTGGGKSLCYQLPALMMERGAILVISPLIALMKDQLDSLPDKVRHLATTINSSLEEDELHRRLALAAQGQYRLIYAAPERLRQPPFLHAMRRAGVDRLVIDEAHCVSVWGHDFRPDYLIVDQARQALGNPPLLALTATAPPRVWRDILRHLGDMRIVAGDVTRPNLRLEVLHARDLDEKLRYLLAFCGAEPGSGIVYADTRARCETLAALLRRHGVAADHYHAGIADRAQVQEAFMEGQVRVIVATVAFGMGIDKPDIRFIVHFMPPPSVAAYYQEIGRAGRDGLPARCLLMYTASDQGMLTRRARQDVMPVEFLRAVYAAVKRRLGGAPAGRIAPADLERDLQVDDTRLRVALNLLEETGLLQRGPDLPRAAVVRLYTDAPAGDLADFCRVARLRTGQPLTLDLAAVARQSGQPMAAIERQVLEWVDAGQIDYRPAGRDMLLEVLPPPQDASERITALLERYDAVQAQRVDEIAAYALTRRCRHGHLNAYLGGRTLEACDACDNCVEVPPPADPGLPGEREQLLIALRCASGGSWSWGRVTLARILCGDSAPGPRDTPLHSKAPDQPGFGALDFRSRAAVERTLDRLEEEGLLQARRLEHGGVVLDVTSRGRAALEMPAQLDELLGITVLPPAPAASVPGGDQELEQDGDEALFQKLRAWRLEQARAQEVAPYVIFHDSHLRAIAARRPLTPEALSEVKGVGPRKLERYGAEVVALVREHLAGDQDAP
jgi:ATP-dependent DNA helicase RecQ